MQMLYFFLPEVKVPWWKKAGNFWGAKNKYAYQFHEKIYAVPFYCQMILSRYSQDIIHCRKHTYVYSYT